MVIKESGSEFQRTLPEYTRLDLKRSILGIGILSFAECDWFRENLTVRLREGGTFPGIIFCIRIPLLYVCFVFCFSLSLSLFSGQE